MNYFSISGVSMQRNPLKISGHCTTTCYGWEGGWSLTFVGRISLNCNVLTSPLKRKTRPCTIFVSVRLQSDYPWITGFRLFILTPWLPAIGWVKPFSDNGIQDVIRQKAIILHSPFFIPWIVWVVVLVVSSFIEIRSVTYRDLFDFNIMWTVFF